MSDGVPVSDALLYNVVRVIEALGGGVVGECQLLHQIGSRIDESNVYVCASNPYAACTFSAGEEWMEAIGE